MATCCYTEADCYTGDMTSATTWVRWISTSTAATTAATGTSSAWVTWVSDSTATSATTSTADDVVWVTWTSSRVVHMDPPTAEQVRAAEAAQQRAAEQEQQRKAAAARATELLRANLSQRQREALDKHGWFLVEGGRTKKTYRVHGDRYAGNIHEIKDGKEVARYCVHADCSIPLGDQLLAQALSLLHDEDHIIGKANKTALAA